MNQLNPTGTTQYKAFSLLAMIYITVILAADVLIYKIATCGSITITVGSLVTPFWFIITDIIAEVYGYQLTRRLIWSGIACSALFTLVCSTLIQFPSPSFWHYQAAYDQVLGKLPRVLLGYIAGVIIGGFANTYLITKWKILTRGKYFWLRSIGSSGAGQLTFTVVTICLDLIGVMPFEKVIQLITISFTIKLIVTTLVALPSTFFVKYLKKLENIDVYDYNTDFNPFKLSIETANTKNHPRE
jgi:uncharacterized integral membrane protein (TIGR00697 family)